MRRWIILTLLLGSAFPGLTQDEINGTWIIPDRKTMDSTNVVKYTEQAARYEEKGVPAKWKKESAIVLRQSVEQQYHLRVKTLNYQTYNSLTKKERVYKKVLLQDQASIDNFSEMTFEEASQKSNEYFYHKIFWIVKIHKPDGKVVEYDKGDAVRISNNIDGNEYPSYKLAIPDLNPGDILELTRTNILVTPIGNDDIYFDPISLWLAGDYPIMEQEYTFRLEPSKFIINYLPLNGCPEPSNKVEDARVLTLKAEDQDRADLPRWSYQYRTVPLMVLKVTAAVKPATMIRFGKFTEGGVTKKDVSDYVNSIVESRLDKNLLAKINSYVKRYKKEDLTVEAKLKRAYYAYRHYSYLSGYEKEAITGGRSKFTYNTGQFVAVMSEFLRRKKIPYKILLTVDKDLYPLGQLVNVGDLELLLMAEGEEIFYLADYGPHSTFNQLPLMYDGTAAWVYDPKVGVESLTGKTVTLPVSASQHNNSSVVTKVSFDAENLRHLKMDNEYAFSGLSKSYYQSNSMTTYEFLREKYNEYGTPAPENNVIGKTEKSRLRNEVESIMAEDDRNRKDYRIYYLEDDYTNSEVLDYESFQLLNNGRWGSREPFSFKESFSLKGLVRKVGPNYMLEVGKLIHEQVELDKKDFERKMDIFMPYARSFSYDITVDIPDGYVLKGVDRLDRKIENETGGFVSQAKVEGNQLKLQVKKYYNHNFEKLEDWPKMVDFLEEAYDFTQSKVLLYKMAE